MEYCLVGLGNPGEQYHYTRHNIGFLTVDAIATSQSGSFKKDKLAYYSKVKYGDITIYLLKPLLYMNRSGEVVAYWLNKLELPLKQILIISDDLHLPLGGIRLRPSGSSGGHNGLKDITNRLSTPEYPRLRIGIGKNYIDGEQSSYVLGNFKRSERKEVEGVIQVAKEAAFSFCTDGIEVAMSLFN